jgi:flavin-dependent dehydrogenase
MYLEVMMYDVIIVGGGLAGLTASICLSKAGLSVLVLEKNTYPNHKVCGEYVSNEVRPFLEYLGLDLEGLGAVPIQNFSISNQNGKVLRTKLPLGGFGLSRFTFDNALYKLALDSQVDFDFKAVTSVVFKERTFQVKTKKGSFQATLVLGAHGKRSNLDKSLNREFMAAKSPWLGVKGHYKIDDFPADHVMLHCFPGGYGGLSITETGVVNLCYLVHYKSFQREKNIASFNKNVVSKNPFLKRFLKDATPIFNEPLSIAQISFEKKKLVNDHVLMCGDSAGLIHPLCGNGMAMAIHAAKIASDIVVRFFEEEAYSRKQMENDYTGQWQSNFSSRLYVGRKVQTVITKSAWINHLFSIIPNSELFLQTIIKQTHGKPILV